VVLREMRVIPGQQYNSAEINDAADRLRGPYFSNVTMTPIGDSPEVRDLVVDVTEARTASFGVGAGVNSNGGLGGNLTYEQRNFDIGDFPDSWSDTFSDRAFIGAGQNLRITLEPGTQASNASIRFTEPWLFDRPYSFSAEGYWRDRIREHWDETRAGGRVTLGKRFDNIHSASIGLRAEDVNVHDIDDQFETVVVDGVTEPVRAPDVLERAGHNTITSATLQLRRDTTNHGPLVYEGTNTTLGWESYGAMGGEFTFQKFSASYDWYTPVYEDLLDRKTVFSIRADGGWIWGSSPFFERYYAGGIGTIRGFSFRGVSPRQGPEEDPVGGNFSLTGSAELGFPLYGDNLRGVVFTDVGTVEPEMEIGTIRSSVGFGFRFTLPILGRAPVALDFALPLSKNSEDDTQWFSFSFGISP
jgi:outer membrane protein insertion porin family